ncbi:MAG: hypothetical protein IH948_06205 [Bacteroidetes bacterium]|nr:hypothetical protein [Bacteroidota bacterium]
MPKITIEVLRAKIFSKTFFYSWIIISSVMFSISYIWHGVILNDFLKIQYPLNLFLSLAIVVYLAIGAMMAAVYSILEVERGYVKKAVIVGVLTGLLIYAIVFLFGISFNGYFDIDHIIVDFSWQTIEQGIGGLVLGVVYEQIKIKEKRWT